MHVVIAGSSRCGTTFMSEFLAQDPKATNYLPESLQLQYILEAYDRCQESATRDAFFAGGDAKPFFVDVVRRFFDQIPIEHSEDLTWVLKCPTMTPYLGRLDELVPGGKYIVMVRDPRDIVTSQIKVARRQRAHGDPPTNALHASENVEKMAIVVLKFYERFFREAAAPLGERVMLLRYEDLMGAPEIVLPRLRAFTGLELAHSPEQDKQNHYGGGFRTELSGGPLTTANVGSHRDVLDAAQVATVERVCAPFMKMFGYVPGSSSDNRAFSASMSSSSSLENRMGGLRTG